MLKSKESKNELSNEEINKIITMRLQGSRPVAWEEDISRNTLDTKPFENLGPPSEMEASCLDNPNRLSVIESLIGKIDIGDYISRDTYPIPCAEDREGYSPGFDGTYWLSGFEDYLKIMEFVDKYSLKPKAVFDFGCASGRLIRHYAAQTEIPEIWGSDINARHIRWLYENLPHTVKPIFNHCIPTLPIPDKSIDVISAFSVFTHIDTFETCWLAELQRIMSDDGLAYITVHNEDTWDLIRDQVDNENNRLVQSMLRIDPTVREALKGPLPDTRTVYRFSQSGPYRAQVFHSNNYLRQVWGRFFEIEEILPGHHVRQTVLVLRKK
jgi:SAM-dependent methyltransferase